MKKIRFSAYGDGDPYKCSEPHDMSGHYYPAVRVDELMGEVRELIFRTLGFVNIHHSGTHLRDELEAMYAKLTPTPAGKE